MVFPIRVPPPEVRAALFTPAPRPAPAQVARGVNLAGAEFGSGNLPGIENRDYVFNSEATFQYFSRKRLNVFRIPFRWERLQPVLGGPLDGAYLSGLTRNIDAARRNGSAVILEPHNFGRYRMRDDGALREYVIDNPYGGTVKVSRGHFADFWRRVSAALQESEGIWAYNLMNEPHDMGAADWKGISQAAVDAIRGNGDGRRILVPGLNWSNSHVWPVVHGPESWIEDPFNNTEYEAHIYFDHDFSGTYALTYDAELRLNPELAGIGAVRLKPFIDWCRNNNVRCTLGEYGVPGGDARWLEVLDRFLSALDEAGASGTYWAAGEWWGDDALSVQPGNNFSVDRPQMEVLTRHLAEDTFWSIPAAGRAGPALAPGSLASGYGVRFAEEVVRAAAEPFPAELGGIAVELTGSDGASTAAPLLAVSPTQINYLVPESATPGWSQIRVLRRGTEAAKARIRVDSVAPALFSADRTGQGAAAAHVLRVGADGSRSYEAGDQPIGFGPEGERLYLILWGTGFGGLTSSMIATVRIGAVTPPVLYAGWGLDVPGLDQVSVELPRTLAGKGKQPVAFRANGRIANLVSVTFR